MDPGRKGRLGGDGNKNGETGSGEGMCGVVLEQKSPDMPFGVRSMVGQEREGWLGSEV